MRNSAEQDARVRDFQAMLNMNAWDYLKRTADEKRELSARQIDEIAIDQVNIVRFAEDRGFRNGIKWVLDEAQRLAEIG